jgi:nitrile hydratase subunit beta
MPWLSFFPLLNRRAGLEAMRPSFLPGDRVSVRQPLVSDASAIPIYVRGKSGIVEEVCEPSTRSGHTISDPGRTPRRQMYRLRFMASEVWPRSPGAAGDTLSLRVSEDLLEPSAPPNPPLDDAFIHARTMEPVAAPDHKPID